MFMCIKCVIKPNSGPGIKMPVFAVDLAVFFKTVKSRGEKFRSSEAATEAGG